MNIGPAGCVDISAQIFRTLRPEKSLCNGVLFISTFTKTGLSCNISFWNRWADSWTCSFFGMVQKKEWRSSKWIWHTWLNTSYLDGPDQSVHSYAGWHSQGGCAVQLEYSAGAITFVIWPYSFGQCLVPGLKLARDRGLSAGKLRRKEKIKERFRIDFFVMILTMDVCYRNEHHSSAILLINCDHHWYSLCLWRSTHGCY
jgi:hypothetical protein